jgi:hypothetical protein
MSPTDHFTAGTTRRNICGHLAAQRHREPSSPAVPPDPIKLPVFAGDLGPGTWVVEVSAGVIPVPVPVDGIAILAGLLPPHTYVTPVRIVRPAVDDSPVWGAQPFPVRPVA